MSINYNECPSTAISKCTDGEDRPFCCTFSQCAYRTKSKQCLRRHQQTHESNPLLRKPFACKFDDCEYRATFEKGLESHVWAKHNPDREKTVLCPLCPSAFYNAAQRLCHIKRTHTEERPYKCKQCNYASKDSSYLSNHVKTVHDKVVQLKCTFPGCNYSTSHTMKTLNAHIKIHDPESSVHRPLTCSFPGCGYKAAFPNRLARHMECRHDPDRRKQFLCSLCPEEFYSRQGLEIHINFSHTKEKIYKCGVCKFETHSHFKFQVHRETCYGEGEKVFQCDLCDYRTRQKRKLNHHKLAEHCEDKKYKCTNSDCQYKTNYPLSYKKHILIHEKGVERQWPFPCSFPGCDYRRKSKGQIIQHERDHKVSSVQLQCESCPERFYPDIKSLRFHIFNNHNNPPFKCSRCEYSGAKRKYLFKHIRYQHEGQPINPRKLSKKSSRWKNFAFDKTPVVLLNKLAVVLL